MAAASRGAKVKEPNRVKASRTSQTAVADREGRSLGIGTVAVAVAAAVLATRAGTRANIWAKRTSFQTPSGTLTKNADAPTMLPTCSGVSLSERVSAILATP